jgi:hypothetical protein
VKAYGALTICVFERNYLLYLLKLGRSPLPSFFSLPKTGGNSVVFGRLFAARRFPPISSSARNWKILVRFGPVSGEQLARETEPKMKSKPKGAKYRNLTARSGASRRGV